MNSYLLHGENHPESRKKLSLLVEEAKSRAWEVIEVNGQKGASIDLGLFSGNLMMFGAGRCLVVENFFSNNKKALQTVKELLSNKDDQLIFIFWEAKAISPAIVRPLAKYLRIEEFKISKALFNFLNSVSPGSSRNALSLLQKVKKESPPDMLLVLLARQIRLMYCLFNDPGGLRLPDWQRKNLEKQAKEFSPEKLLLLHAQLLELDRKNKRSQLPEDLQSSLELLIASV